MMRALAIAILAVAGCRNESSVESQPQPQPQPLEPSGSPVAQATPPPRETTDDRTATSIEDELPPSLFEANKGSKDRKKKDKDKDKEKDKDKPKDEPPVAKAEPQAPAMKPSRIAPFKSALCVTTGAAKIGGTIDKAAMRAVAKGTDGEAAAMTFTFNGETADQKKLASGEVRRQIGLKLRAENGCNLLYVMWRLEPKPMIVAQMKRNPGAKDHKACGTAGYKWLKAAEQTTPPTLKPGDKHTLRAEIENEELKVYIGETLYWRGMLPDTVRDLRGPAGMRSDNVAYDLLGFDVALANADIGNAKCVDEDKD